MLSLRGLLQILLFVVLVVLFIIYLRDFERRSIFYPNKEIEYLPAQVGLGYEEVFFKAPDNLDINAWFLPCKDARYTLLFCHGNAGNIGHRLEKLKFFHSLGLNILIFDYRGYGRSKGSPSERGLYRDAQAAYNYLLSRKINPDEIIGYGESLGGAVVIDLACKNKLSSLIIDSTFSNAKDMAKIMYPSLPYWIFSSRFDSIDKIKSIKAPKLIIHSIDDDVVPYDLGRKLYDAAPPPKEFLEIRGEHNNGFLESEPILREKIAEFLKKL